MQDKYRLAVSGIVAGTTEGTDIGSMATRIDISNLTPAERLQLVEELWDSLSPAEIPLTAAQAAEVDRREALHRADPHRGRPWRDVLDEIEHRRG